MSDIEDAQVEIIEGKEEPSSAPIEEKFCYFCKDSLKDTFNFYNQGIELGKHMLIPKEEICHYECYIREIIRKERSEK